jgi:hypothetical protein
MYSSYERVETNRNLFLEAPGGTIAIQNERVVEDPRSLTLAPALV